MIQDVTTYTVKMGTHAAVIQWLKRAAEYHKAQGRTFRIHSPVNGITAKVIIQTEYESLQDMSEVYRDFWQSDAWKTMDKEPWQEWFVEAGSYRHQYSIVE